MAPWFGVARHIGSATLAGVIAGVVVGGVVGRVAMRISGFMAGPNMVGVHTANGNRVGDITIDGTFAMVVFAGVIPGVAGGVFYAAVEPWVRRLRPWHGLVYGVGLLATLGFTVLDPSNFDFARFGSLPVNIAMFAAMFVTFGVMTAWLFDVVSRYRNGTGSMARATDVLAWLAVVPAVAAVLSFLGGVAGVPTIVAIAMVGALLVPALVRWRGLPQPIGYACFAAVLLLGTLRTFDSLQLFRGF
jgi:hypothetical protein